ncbi:hypothetical protein CEXT_431051 [Caerostris extrusa]|uniref:Uncharacterized protein n=1 Tax=Caerostris extrusa TaxID=172846 RepID=A0AAV4PN65_CAEEX|nr:hypothetical protein CEXT_431051 [Caerostris extrusa]
MLLLSVFTTKFVSGCYNDLLVFYRHSFPHPPHQRVLVFISVLFLPQPWRVFFLDDDRSFWLISRLNTIDWMMPFCASVVTIRDNNVNGWRLEILPLSIRAEKMEKPFVCL